MTEPATRGCLVAAWEVHCVRPSLPSLLYPFSWSCGTDTLLSLAIIARATRVLNIANHDGAKSVPISMRTTNASDFHTLYEMHRGVGDREVRWHVKRVLQFVGDLSR